MNPPQIRAERCIDCEEMELARVSDARPWRTLPIPTSAIEGLPGGRDSGALTRRRLLQGGVAGFASVYASKVLGFQEIFEAAVAQATPSSQNCLVVLYLAGGNDGMGVTLPGSGLASDYAAYKAARPALHRGQGATSGGVVGSQDIPGLGNELAWANVVVSSGAGGDNGNPTYGFDKLYGDGLGGTGSDLAVLPAVDYWPGSLSHFDSTDYWFAGALTGLSTGWLGRWIDNNGSAANPLQAVSIDTALSKAIRASHNPVCAIPAIGGGKAPGLGFSMRTGGYDSPASGATNANINTQMGSLSGVAGDPSNAYLVRSRATYGQAVSVAADGAAINGGNSGSYPDASGSLSTRLQLAARILAAGLGTRIITIHWGSFDTHGSQLATQDPQLSELSRALGAFKADLIARGIEQNVTTMVFSEFGRRVHENGSAGTDHGCGGSVMLSGSAVKGGLASQFPGCTNASLDTNGNLKPTTDFRTVYQHVLGEWLGGDLTGVLPDAPASTPPLQRYDGGNTLFK